MPENHSSRLTLPLVLIDLSLLLLLIGLFYSLFLGSYALLNPDEARYATISQEMLLSKDWITPHLNHLVYLEKPILFYWLQAFAIKLFGPGEWVIRLWTTLLAVLGCGITYLAGLKLYNRKTGILAALILATSPLYFALAHVATIDMTLTFWITLSLLSLWFGLQEPIVRRRYLYLSIAAITSGFAVLTKGLIGIVFPLAIVGLWMILLGQWRLIKWKELMYTASLFFIIVLPWHILVQLRNPAFFHFYFIEQQFLRYSTMIAERYAPIYFFGVVLLLGVLPWTAFFFQTIILHFPRWKNRSHDSKEIFLLLWIGMIFIFFSLSHSKLVPYILPLMAPVAILLGHYLQQKLDHPSPASNFPLNLGFIGMSFLILALSIVLSLVPKYYEVENTILAQHWFSITSFSLILTTILALLLLYRKNAWLTLLAWICGLSVSYVLFIQSIPAFNTQSIKPLAMVIHQRASADSEIVAFMHYYQDLPFYTQRKVSVVGTIGELAFGLTQHKGPHWVFDDATFWKHFSGSKRLWVITFKKHYQDLKKEHPATKFYVLKETTRNVLFSNFK